MTMLVVISSANFIFKDDILNLVFINLLISYVIAIMKN